MARVLKKSYLQACKSHDIGPLSAVKAACKKTIDGRLNLSTVYLTKEQCQAVGEAIVKCQLYELYLTDCLIGDQGILCIVSGFYTLSKLDLKGNELTECGYELGTFLKTSKAITHLTLEWNTIGSSETSLVALSEGIAMSTSLVYLNLSNNQISHCGASFISSALVTNETLMELDLKWNSLGVIGGRELLSSLKLNTHLEELHLVGNNITNDILEAIATTLTVKSRHCHAQKEWDVQKHYLQTKSELKEKENELKVCSLYDELEEMRLSSLGITEKACDEIVTLKAEIESCYAKITSLEDQLLSAKISLESVEEKYSSLEDEYHITVEQKEKKISNLSDQLHSKHKEGLDLKEKLKKLEEQVTRMEHDLQHKMKLASMERESTREMMQCMERDLSTVKESKANKIKELEDEINTLTRSKNEELQKAREGYQLELLKNQSVWDKEKSLMTEQLQSSFSKLKDLQKEHEEIHCQLRSERANFTQSTNELRKEIQMQHSSEVGELNQKLAKMQQNYESAKADLDRTVMKLNTAKSEIDNNEDHLRQKDIKYSQSIKASDEQQTKMLSMMNQQSQEYEALRQQKNHFEQLYEDQKHLLHKTKEDNSKLKSDLEKEMEDRNKEVSKLQQSLVEARQKLQHFKEHEKERATHLKNALETYLHSDFQ